MLRRASLVALGAFAWLLVVAVPAIANDNGEGLLGETDDKIVTFFSLGVVLFLASFVIVLSLLQRRRERRKEQKRAATLRQRIGW